MGIARPKQSYTVPSPENRNGANGSRPAAFRKGDREGSEYDFRIFDFPQKFPEIHGGRKHCRGGEFGSHFGMGR
jgi:hypothetical protein